MRPVISLKRSTRSWIGFMADEQVLADRLVQLQLRLLGHVADAHAFGQTGRAVEVPVDAGHDPQQRRLARPVFAHHADLRPVVRTTG